jgi:hypothetical protein
MDLSLKGESWDEADFMTEVIDPLRLASTVSASYNYAQARMEQAIYALDLPGLSGFDLSKGAHLSSGKLMKVFTYYTAYLDNQEHDFAGTKTIVDLDHMTYPPTPTAGISRPEEDPALRGHMIVRYFEYVKECIYLKSQGFSSLDAMYIPAPKDSKWDIKEFDEWVKTEGNYQTLDPLDMQKAYDHDPAKHAAGEHTELDEALKAEFQKAADSLKMQIPPTILDYQAIEMYLKNKDPDPLLTGLFVRVEDPPGSGKYSSMLWEKTDRIASSSSGHRSVQVQQMQVEVERFVQMIFTEKWPNGKLKFFKEQPSLTEQAKVWFRRKWPGLYAKFFN